MATYIALMNFTEQGVKNFRQSLARAVALKAAAKKVGAKVQSVYWTMGAFDGVILFEARNDETATSLMLSLAALGNVRTTTLRAFTAAEMQTIVTRAPKS